MVRSTGSAPIDLINDNFGDYRNDRFHLGIDIQQAPNTTIHPVDSGRVCRKINSGSYTWFLIEHGNISPTACNPQNIHSAYLHLTTDVPNDNTINNGSSVNQNTVLGSGSTMNQGHLHLNIVTDPNNLDDLNDDNVINPLSEITWQEIENGDIRPHDNRNAEHPHLHYLYLRTESVSSATLNYPENYANLVFIDDPQTNYHKIQYQGGTQACQIGRL